jgi:hypothetical protein
MKRHQLAIMTTTAALFLGVSGASADTKTIPGFTCKKAGGGVYAVQYGSIYNAGSNNMTVICPIVKDASSMSAVVRVADRHPARNFRCWLWAESASGSSFTEDGGDNSTDEQFGAGFFDANYHALPLPAPSAQDFNFIECRIPAADGQNYSHLGSVTSNES